MSPIERLQQKYTELELHYQSISRALSLLRERRAFETDVLEILKLDNLIRQKEQEQSDIERKMIAVEQSISSSQAERSPKPNPSRSHHRPTTPATLFSPSPSLRSTPSKSTASPPSLMPFLARWWFVLPTLIVWLLVGSQGVGDHTTQRAMFLAICGGIGGCISGLLGSLAKQQKTRAANGVEVSLIWMLSGLVSGALVWTIIGLVLPSIIEYYGAGIGLMVGIGVVLYFRLNGK